LKRSRRIQRPVGGEAVRTAEAPYSTKVSLGASEPVMWSSSAIAGSLLEGGAVTRSALAAVEKRVEVVGEP
jgi:hypothetical protein